MSFEDFVDERMLVSHNVFGDKEMKIKILEVSDEHPPTQWKFGDRVKVNKILVTIKHLKTQQIEEGEFDIEAIEDELRQRSHYTSTNRWVSVNDIKNGYVVNTTRSTIRSVFDTRRHASLITHAVHRYNSVHRAL
jgi:REP element-mobilizing transposase RayT